MISCDTITEISRQNCFEFKIKTVHFIKVDSHCSWALESRPMPPALALRHPVSKSLPEHVHIAGGGKEDILLAVERDTP